MKVYFAAVEPHNIDKMGGNYIIFYVHIGIGLGQFHLGNQLLNI